MRLPPSPEADWWTALDEPASRRGERPRRSRGWLAAVGVVALALILAAAGVLGLVADEATCPPGPPGVSAPCSPGPR